MKRWTSRKFVMALAAQVAALAVLIWPSRAEVIGRVIESVAALAVAVLAALGYITVEGAIDKTRAERGGGPASTRATHGAEAIDAAEAVDRS